MQVPGPPFSAGQGREAQACPSLKDKWLSLGLAVKCLRNSLLSLPSFRLSSTESDLLRAPPTFPPFPLPGKHQKSLAHLILSWHLLLGGSDGQNHFHLHVNDLIFIPCCKILLFIQLFPPASAPFHLFFLSTLSQ